MADLAYKGSTIPEVPQPSHVSGHQYWSIRDGNAELTVGLNTVTGVYTAVARVIRPHPVEAGELRLPAGVAEGTNHVAQLSQACNGFITRGNKPPGQQYPREQEIRGQDVAEMASILARPDDPGPQGMRVR